MTAAASVQRTRSVAATWGLAALLALPGPARAQAPGEVEAPSAVAAPASAFEAGAPAPPWADPPRAPTAAPDGPASDAVVQVADTQIHVGPPKAVLIRREMRVRDVHALDQVGHVRTDYQPAFETLRLHRLEILRDGAVIDHTRTVPVRFLQREQGLEDSVYSGVTTASIQVPGLRVGDTLRVVLSITGTHPVLGTRLAQRVHWDADHTIGWRRVTVVAPASPPLHWQWMGGAGAPGPAPVVETAPDGTRRLRFEAAALAPIRTESDLAADTEPARTLQFSTWQSWGEVARWADALFPADAPLPAEALALVARLQALPGRDEQVSQALQWVQREIRNWSTAFGEGSHRPRPPAEVLRRRYGDCKDKSWLLMRLLQALGIEAQPVLVSAASLRGPVAWLPSPDPFDHVIVRTRVDGRDHYLDPTRQGQTGRLARMGQMFEGAAVLPVGQDSDALVAIRSPNREEIWTLALTERFQVDRFDGDARLETESRWTGAAAELLRMTGLDADAAHWRSVLLREYGARYPGLSLVGTPELLDDRVDNVIRLRGRFELPRPLRDAGDGAWALPATPANFRGSLALPGQARRRFPLAVPAYPTQRRYEVEVVWPPAVDAARAPRSQRLHTPHFAFDLSETFRGRVQRRTLHFNPLLPAVPVAELPRFSHDVFDLESLVGMPLVAQPADCGGACQDAPGPGR